MSEWKVFETETMAIIARSRQEVLDYLVKGIGLDEEDAQMEIEDIKEIPLTKTCSLTFIDDTELNQADYPDGFTVTYKDYTGQGDMRPVLSAPYQLFVDMAVKAGDVPSMIWCSEY